jgi:hypothetical protein
MVDFTPIDAAFFEVIKTLKETAKDNPVLQKKIAIMENAHEMGKSVVELAQLSTRKKRLFRPINRNPKNKIQKKAKIFKKIVDIQMARMRHEMILQTPIPKYPKGASEMGTIGETGPEIIMRPPSISYTQH